jgi:hypothetical protein
VTVVVEELNVLSSDSQQQQQQQQQPLLDSGAEKADLHEWRSREDQGGHPVVVEVQEAAVNSSRNQSSLSTSSSGSSSRPSLHGPLSAALLASCVGVDVSSEASGTWLPAADLFKQTKAGRATCASAAAAVTAPLAMAEPADGCRTITNGPLLKGSVAVVKRGSCSFLDKVMSLQRSGAVGVVVLNLLPPGDLITMSADDSGRMPDIPAVLVGGEDAKQLLWWVQRKPMVGTIVQEEDMVSSSSSDGISHSGKGSSKQQQQPRIHTRVDLFVPGPSQHWIRQHIGDIVGEGRAVLEQLVRDPVTVAALQEVAAHPIKLP